MGLVLVFDRSRLSVTKLALCENSAAMTVHLGDLANQHAGDRDDMATEIPERSRLAGDL